MEIARYNRKSFGVDAVQVTNENIKEVAEWCGGAVYVKAVRTPKDVEDVQTIAYVKVPVRRPNNERQTQAFPGDWVLKSEQGFKVYGPKAFADSFESAGDGVEETSVGLSSETEVSDGVAEISVGFRGGY